MTDLIPQPWEFVVLTLGAYRLVRLAGWDEFPLAARLRAALVGESWVPVRPEIATPLDDFGVRSADQQLADAVTDLEAAADEPELPGKQPSSGVDDVRPAYSRPTLAHLIHCPFCVGWWISLVAVVAFWLAPSATLLVLAPFAVSGAVGLVAKNLD